MLFLLTGVICCPGRISFQSSSSSKMAGTGDRTTASLDPVARSCERAASPTPLAASGMDEGTSPSMAKEDGDAVGAGRLGAGAGWSSAPTTLPMSISAPRRSATWRFCIPADGRGTRKWRESQRTAREMCCAAPTMSAVRRGVVSVGPSSHTSTRSSPGAAFERRGWRSGLVHCWVPCAPDFVPHPTSLSSAFAGRVSLFPPQHLPGFLPGTAASARNQDRILRPCSTPLRVLPSKRISADFLRPRGRNYPLLVCI